MTLVLLARIQNWAIQNAFLVLRGNFLGLEVRLAACAVLEPLPAKQEARNVSCVLLERMQKRGVQNVFLVPWGNFPVLEVWLAACAVLGPLPDKQAVRNVSCVLLEHMQKQAVPSVLHVMRAQFQAQAVGIAATALQVILPKTQWRVKHVQVALLLLTVRVAAVRQVVCPVPQARLVQVATAF